MLLYMIRHGETEYNRTGRLQGRVNNPLNARGIRLAEETAKGLADIKFDMVISSPLIRAVQTAGIIMGTRKIPCIMEERITEINWGIWEGMCIQKGKYEVPEKEFNLFHTDPFGFVPPEGGESIKDVCTRTGEFYRELIHTKAYNDKTILISTHGCAVRGILNQVYSNKEDFWHGSVPENCAVNVVEVKNEKSRLIEEDRLFYDPGENVNFYHL